MLSGLAVGLSGYGSSNSDTSDTASSTTESILDSVSLYVSLPSASRISPMMAISAEGRLRLRSLNEFSGKCFARYLTKRPFPHHVDKLGLRLDLEIINDCH